MKNERVGRDMIVDSEENRILENGERGHSGY